MVPPPGSRSESFSTELRIKGTPSFLSQEDHVEHRHLQCVIALLCIAHPPVPYFFLPYYPLVALERNIVPESWSQAFGKPRDVSLGELPCHLLKPIQLTDGPSLKWLLRRTGIISLNYHRWLCCIKCYAITQGLSYWKKNLLSKIVGKHASSPCTPHLMEWKLGSWIKIQPHLIHFPCGGNVWLSSFTTA